mgnify:CR=1 FL=1
MAHVLIVEAAGTAGQVLEIRAATNTGVLRAASAVLNLEGGGILNAGGTIEASDVEALTPWLDWAFETLVAEINSNFPGVNTLEIVFEAKQALDLVPEADRKGDHYTSAAAALKLLTEAAALSGTAELERKLAANPDDHEARFELAGFLQAHGTRDEMLAELLRLQGHVVHTAHDGVQAVALAEQVHPDVLVLDVSMPGRTASIAERCASRTAP